jgi:tetratricopeptide (TPR) repeat protein
MHPQPQTPIFPLPETRTTFGVYILFMLALTWLTFGSLATHLFDTDDLERLSESSAAINNPSSYFSPEKIHPIRPLYDLIFMLGMLVWEDNPAAHHLLVVFLHLLASLLLAHTVRQLGVPFELSLLSGLLFLLNIAHFRAVHWVICGWYTFALIFALKTVAYFQNGWLKTGQMSWMIKSMAALTAAIFSHPTTVAVAPFCLYLAYRQKASAKKAITACWPLLALGVLSVMVAYAISPGSTQVHGVSTAPQPSLLVTNLFWFLSRLITTAHWILVGLSDRVYPIELAVGFAMCVGTVVLYWRRIFPAADWAVWMVLTVLPFIGHPSTEVRWLPAGPSRQLYLPSVGSSLLLACLIGAIARRCQTRFGLETARVVYGLLVAATVSSSYIASKRSEAVSFYTSGRSYIARYYTDLGCQQLSRAFTHDASLVPFDAYSRLAASCFPSGKAQTHILADGLKRYPNHPELLLLLGISTFLHDDPDVQSRGQAQILKAFQQVTDEDRQELRHSAALIFQNMAFYFHQNKNYERAAELYEKALHFQPDYSIALVNLGKVLYALNRTDDAIQAMVSAARLDPMHLNIIFVIGNKFYKKNRFEDAQAVYQKALAIAPENPDLHHNLGLALKGQKKNAEAATAFEAALEIAPDKTEARYHLADVLKDLQEFKRAILEYRRIIQQQPERVGAYHNLGAVLLSQNLPAEALPILRKTVELDGRNFNAWILLGLTHQQLGNPKDARKAYQQVLTLDPQNAVARARLQDL